MFGIEKKGPTEVFNDTVKSDGYLLKDIEGKITTKGIQEFVGTSEESTEVLWRMLITQVEGKLTVSAPPAISASPHGITKAGVPRKCPYFCKKKDEHGKR